MSDKPRIGRPPGRKFTAKFMIKFTETEREVFEAAVPAKQRSAFIRATLFEKLDQLKKLENPLTA